MERTDQHPIRFILGRYGGLRAAGFALSLALVGFSLLPQRVPALLIGVGVDSLLLETADYRLPGVPGAWLPTTTMGQLWLTVGLLGAAVLLESATSLVGRYLYNHASLWTLHDVRVGAYEAVTGLEMGYFDDEDAGELMSVLNDDVNNVRSLFDAVRDGVVYGGRLVVAFAFMLLVHWELALVVLAIMVGLVASSYVYSRLLQPRYRAVRESVGSINGALRDTVDGIDTVKAYVGEDRQQRRLSATSAEYKRSNWSTIRLRLGYQAASYSLASVGSWGLFLFGSYWILSGPPLFFRTPLTPGALLTFLIYAQSFVGPTRNLVVNVLDKYENSVASASRVVGLLTDARSLDERSDTDELRVTDGRVEYDDVSFRYGDADELTLDSVDFTAEPGAFVGVVGSTGAGKSTLLKLLFRFYDPDDGSIRIDGRDVRDVPVQGLREQIGYVSQDPFLFPGTVRENVAYGRPDADREEVVEAAKRARAHEFVRDLPEGYETTVGEEGDLLSGGQRQRIALARAILAEPPILVLDEATSHVDNETEALIKRRLSDIAADRTTFAIAHRLSTVRHADQILVLDDGRLVESGTHDELVAADGLYADLWRVQVGAVESVSGAFLRQAGAPAEVDR